jgi:DNA-binding MarR family transcriptional regulator
MNGVLATLEREKLIERHPHPTHGRILQVQLTDEGRRRVDAATPGIRALEHTIEADFTPDEIAIVKRWLVESALRTDRLDTTRRA